MITLYFYISMVVLVLALLISTFRILRECK